MFSTLQSAKHFVRTGYGDSTGYYIGSSFPKPMHGIGQGNGGGPIIWAVLSSPILNLMRASGYGAEFICPLSMVKTSFGGYAFIDDTDLVVAKLSFLTYIKVAHALQSSMTLWEKGLKATSGAIVPKKTYVYKDLMLPSLSDQLDKKTMRQSHDSIIELCFASNWSMQNFSKRPNLCAY
jgi:hypothetical protein